MKPYLIDGTDAGFQSTWIDLEAVAALTEVHDGTTYTAIGDQALCSFTITVAFCQNPLVIRIHSPLVFRGLDHVGMPRNTVEPMDPAKHQAFLKVHADLLYAWTNR